MKTSFFLSSFILFHVSLVLCAIPPPYKAVNLGNWLVIEGWMKPSLFDGIPNKDPLDGTQIQLKSAMPNKMVTAENGGGGSLLPSRDTTSVWETFRLWRIRESSFNLRVNNKQFVGVNNQGGLIAVSSKPGLAETFEIVRNAKNQNRICIKASSNGMFFQATSDTTLTASGGEGLGWRNDDTSVFNITIVKTLRGEYQITNGYGPAKAAEVLRDFIFLSSNSVNPVRIPVGCWIASDPTPEPFVGGSLNASDNAFTWAQNHNMMVIIGLHALRVSQNGNDHSGTRDGYQEWGDSNINETIKVIDFLANRYGKNPSPAAIELINEPTGPGVTAQTLLTYYQKSYDTVRKYTNAYVNLSNRLGEHDPKEFLSLGSRLKGSVIDVHYYSLYNDKFKTMTVQENIDYIHTNRANQLNGITQQDGDLTFVDKLAGEWTGESGKWGEQGKPMQDYVDFVNAQTEVYGRASFGWAYWSYRNKFNHWSMKWMIENYYIKL